MHRTRLERSLEVLLFAFLVVGGLYYVKPFLVPLCFAGLFAMLFLPLSRRFENKGAGRALSAFLCVLILLLIIVGIVVLIAWQVTDLVSDLGNIEQKIKQLVSQVEQFVSRSFGISRQQQEEVIQEQSKNTNGMIAAMVPSVMGLLVDFILMIVYTFLLMYQRTQIKKFILQIVPKKENSTTEDAIRDIQKVGQQYLIGLGLMIVALWIMYGIAFSIIGLKNALFFAILCGLLEIVPFAGNLTGNAIAVLMALTQGGSTVMVLGILISYAVIQFIQTYILEPLVVGANVNINPLFTIMGLVVGELIWGIPGMVLAIPLLGIVKIICDHIEPLKPYGFLIGTVGKKRTALFKRKNSEL
jgi:predicted PurR-regulated permease PerM